MNKEIREIAIGGFDGMHRAHQKLFNLLHNEYGAILVIDRAHANITPQKEREHYTHLPIFYLQLNEIKHLNDDGFLLHLYKMFPKLEKIVVGYDFHFGKDRRYTYKDLKEKFRGSVAIVERVSINNDSIHSHKIREFIKDANIQKANQYLGHNYTIEGIIIKGQGLGKKELFATINIACEKFLLPKEGVYATLTQFDDNEHYYPSVSFLGHRKSTDGSFAIESHILDETIEAKERARIAFIGFIRENQKFEKLEDLKKAIKNDILTAKKQISHINL